MKQQHGAVSIFVVIFAMLLFSAVSVGFTILMLRDQDRATDNDLSQSALDSAKAGVEDAKRVLAKYNDCKERGTTGPGHPGCMGVIAAIEDNKCDTVSRIMGAPNQEQKVQQTVNDQALEQAYTCVKITPNTDTVIKTIRDEGQIRLVPLKAVSDYDTIEISWHEKAQGVTYDFSTTSKETALGDEKNGTSAEQLPTEEKWQDGWGSVLRVQAMSYKPGEVKPTDIDSKLRTVFLYPGFRAPGSPIATVDMNIDKHRPLGDPTTESDGAELALMYNTPQVVGCDKEVDEGKMLCKARITNVRQDPGDQAYLAIAGAYQKGNPIKFEVRMLKDDNTVKFDGVQPSIDATGRANNVFRRIDARVETHASLEDAMPLPRAALGVRGDVCKSYIVTDHPDEYQESCAGSGGDPTQQPASADEALRADAGASGGGGAAPGDGAGSGTGGSGSSGGSTAGLPAPYRATIGGKEYTITPRLKVQQECTGIWPFNRTCKDVRYAEHVYSATEEQCSGWPWNRTCKDVTVEKIYKTERL